MQIIKQRGLNVLPAEMLSYWTDGSWDTVRWSHRGPAQTRKGPVGRVQEQMIQWR